MQTAIQKSQNLQVTIVGQDIDLLVLVIALSPADKDIFFLKPNIGKIKAKLFSSQNLQMQFTNVKSFILLAHAFSGCDTTSSVHGKGKKQLLKLLENNRNLDNAVAVFNSVNSNKSEVEKAGEKLFLILYGSKDERQTLD